MNKRDAIYLQDMPDHAHKLRDLAERTSREQYAADETLRAACRYWLQVIGEAASRVSTALQERHPNIAWRPMIGMRNRIVHDYLGIDDDTVWRTVVERIPELIEQLTALLDSDRVNDS